MRVLIVCIGLLVTLSSSAATWLFTPEMRVSDQVSKGGFHHLDSAGRKNLAVGAHQVAVIWEDRHAGSEQVYLAFKDLQGNQFSAARRLSTGSAAYEPVLAWLRDDLFVAAWEQEGRILARLCRARTLGPVTVLGGLDAAQVSLVADGENRAFAVWAQRDGQQMRIMSTRLTVDAKGELKAQAPIAVTPAPLSGDQAYPAATIGRAGVVVAWEDRSNKSTMLQTAFSANRQTFSAPTTLNEIIRKSAVFGEASTVARITLARLGADHLAAVWLDKREYRSGYKVFSALSHDGGRSFGLNEKVQDDFGDSTPQWHAAVAAHKGRLVAVWDDARDDVQKIWMAWRGSNGWSDNIAVTPDTGLAEHTSPTVAFDPAGNLHLAWIKREGADTELIYRMGRFKP